MGTLSILVKSFLEKSALLKLLLNMTTQVKFYIKSLSAGQKGAFYVSGNLIFQCYKFIIIYLNFIK